MMPTEIKTEPTDLHYSDNDARCNLVSFESVDHNGQIDGRFSNSSSVLSATVSSNFAHLNVQHLSNGLDRPASSGSVGSIVSSESRSVPSAKRDTSNNNGNGNGITVQQSKLGDNVMARLCMHRIRLMGPRWYKAVSHIRVGKKKKEKKKMFNDLDYERLDEAKDIAFEMIPADLVDVAGNLLKKVFKEVQEDSKELLILAWLSGCAGAEELVSAQDRCVLTQPDGKGKMKRIDGLRGSDKVWRLDTLVAILFHGVPMDSTDTNLLVHRCQEELCINPHHFMFQCSPAMVAVVGEMLKLRGFEVVQRDPLLEGGAQASDRDKGHYQFTSPFNITTIQKEVHENMLFPASALEKYALASEDILFIQQHLPTALLQRLNLTVGKGAPNLSSASNGAFSNQFTQLQIKTSRVDSPLHAFSKCNTPSSKQQQQQLLLQKSSNFALGENCWPSHHPAAPSTLVNVTAEPYSPEMLPDSSVTATPELNRGGGINRIREVCGPPLLIGPHIPNYPTNKRQPLNDSPDSQMPIKKRRIISDSYELSPPNNELLVKSDPEPAMLNTMVVPPQIGSGFIRSTGSVFQPVRQLQVSTQSSSMPAPDEVTSPISSTTADSTTLISTMKSEAGNLSDTSSYNCTNVSGGIIGSSSHLRGLTPGCNMLNASATEQEMEEINNSSEIELRRRVQQLHQQHYLAAWQNMVARSPYSSPIADMMNLGVAMTSPLSFWAPQPPPVVPLPTMGLSSIPTLARPKPLVPNSDGRGGFRERDSNLAAAAAAAAAAGGGCVITSSAALEAKLNELVERSAVARNCMAAQSDAFIPIRGAQSNGSCSAAEQQFMSHHLVAAAAIAAAHSRGGFSPLAVPLRSTPISTNASPARLTPMILDDYMKLNYQRSYPYREIDDLSNFLRAQPGTTGCTPTFSVAGAGAAGLCHSHSESPAAKPLLSAAALHQQLMQHRKSVTSMLSNGGCVDFPAPSLPAPRPSSAQQQRFSSAMAAAGVEPSAFMVDKLQ